MVLYIRYRNRTGARTAFRERNDLCSCGGIPESGMAVVFVFSLLHTSVPSLLNFSVSCASFYLVFIFAVYTVSIRQSRGGDFTRNIARSWRGEETGRLYPQSRVQGESAKCKGRNAQASDIGDETGLFTSSGDPTERRAAIVGSVKPPTLSGNVTCINRSPKPGATGSRLRTQTG